MASSDSKWLANAFGYTFNDDHLLQQALTHRSASAANNERLEFLGDAILDLVISDAVYRLRPDAAEGDLSRLRASLVNSQSLAALAASLGVGERLQLGAGERKSGGHRRESILADALEALFGAIYLDAGAAVADQVIRRVFATRLAELPAVADLRDPKTKLQEWLQSRGRPLPEYDLRGVSGKAHRQVFEVCCSLNDSQQQSIGTGRSRRAAEQEAAAAMLQTLEGGAPAQ